MTILYKLEAVPSEPEMSRVRVFRDDEQLFFFDLDNISKTVYHYVDAELFTFGHVSYERSVGRVAKEKGIDL